MRISLQIVPVGTPTVTNIGGMSSQDVQNFLNANGVNKDVWVVKDGALKFAYTIPEEIIVNTFYGIFLF